MNNNKGFVAILFFFMMVAVSLAVTPLILNSISFHAINETEHAFYISEGGVKYYAQLLKGDYDWSDDLGVARNFGGGRFSVSIVGPNPREIARLVIASTGTITLGATDFNRVVEQILYSSRGAFNGRSSIFGPGDASFSGNNKVQIGNPADPLHPSDIFIGGDLTVINTDPFNVTGQTLTNQPAVRMPTVNWSYWQTRAENSGAGHVITGDYVFSAPYTGVYYVIGNVIIQNMNNQTCNGTIVATGNITIVNNAKVTFNVAAGDPAFISGGTVDFYNCNEPTIKGAIYAANNLLIHGVSNALIQGTLVFGGLFNCYDNNKPVTIDPSLGSGSGGGGSGTGLGDGFGGGGDAVVLTGFKEL